MTGLSRGLKGHCRILLILLQPLCSLAGCVPYSCRVPAQTIESDQEAAIRLLNAIYRPGATPDRVLVDDTPVPLFEPASSRGLKRRLASLQAERAPRKIVIQSESAHGGLDPSRILTVHY